MDKDSVLGLITLLGSAVKEKYVQNKSCLSFFDFYALLVDDVPLYIRNSAQYLKDVFDYFGKKEIETPLGKVTRFNLFDIPFDNGNERLIGQEEVQEGFYRNLINFVNDGKINKLLLLHGPNGSAKSSFIACMFRAMQYYSTLPEGALYSFNWVFPTSKISKANIGFGSKEDDLTHLNTFAFLEDSKIDAKIPCDVYDNPILLIPKDERKRLFEKYFTDKAFVVSDYALYGNLCHKCKQIYDALLSSYNGDYLKVLRHIQIERFYISRRYRRGAITIEPQLRVDAAIRQITSDRSLSALPSSLQNITLFEPFGDLVDANRGMLEYNDLLKRPIETFKYLLATCEKNNVNLETMILYIDTIMVGSSNEKHLAAFKEIPDFSSFKGRIELLKTPYLLNFRLEKRIYDDQVAEKSIKKHVAPHTTLVAALWAILTRMRKPIAPHYSKSIQGLVDKITPLEKALLYADGKVPDYFAVDQGKELLKDLKEGRIETEVYPDYEGRYGASPREIKSVIMNAGQNEKYRCLCPMTIFEELSELVKDLSVYEFLNLEPIGEFHQNVDFIKVVQEYYYQIIDNEVKSSIGLIDFEQYLEVFKKYIQHISHWVKREKIRNAVTQKFEEPDEKFMTEIEAMFKINIPAKEFRQNTISTIGAFSVEHPGIKVDYLKLFPKYLSLIQENYFNKKLKQLEKIIENLLRYITEKEVEFTSEEMKQMVKTMDFMKEKYGYCEYCARDVMVHVLKKRFAKT